MTGFPRDRGARFGSRTTGMIRGVLLALIATAVMAGCSRPQPAAPPPLRIEDVPPEIMKVAREQLPDVAFDTVWRKPSGTFEIRGKARNGKVREVEVRPDGTVEEVE